jgi:hypothetical protein
MNKSKYLILGLLLIMVCLADPADAIICKPAVQTPAYKQSQVTEVKEEGIFPPSQGGWYYNISWKPARHHQTGALVKKYKVAGYLCSGHKYTCTDARCNAEISGCSGKASYAMITADYGAKISGIRFYVIYKPGVCD